MADKKLPYAPRHARHSILTGTASINNVIATEGKEMRAEIDELTYEATTIEKAGKATFDALEKARMTEQGAGLRMKEERRGPKF